jgi:hypothetical protein
MKARNITAALKNRDKGWVAINEKNEVVESASTFAIICKKVEKIKEELTLVPATKDYSGFITPLQRFC